ncbi:MAG: hypothetical protein GPOALKHO_001451 [Sodalis sp.]|nr:MAG: hypothetical protein GPOALKHO_001451 [Sodalis sp.]
MIFHRYWQSGPICRKFLIVLAYYLTQAVNYDAAYEAFDSLLVELDPTYNYTYFNRGIALYYGGRYSLVQDDRPKQSLPFAMAFS